MAKHLIILAACAAMGACASNQPASKTFLIAGDTKLLTPASPAITANDQASSAATIVAVREFEYQGAPSGTAKGTASTLGKDAVSFTPAMNLGNLAVIGIAVVASSIAGAAGHAVDVANAKTLGYEITYQVDGSETTAMVIDMNPSFKPVPGARIKVRKTAFASVVSPLQ
jgi:outer membrane lipoprotein SlyB